MQLLPPPLINYPWEKIISQNIKTALLEDLNGFDLANDITARLLPDNQEITATLSTREAGILAGQDWFTMAFTHLDSSINCHWQLADGASFQPGQTLAKINGNSRVILTAERTAMNFLQTLSATASQTAEMVQLIKHTPCHLLDTRKTLPGLRMAQKYAVHCGGGMNHRIGLYDRFLIKENHIIAASGIEMAVRKARKISKLQGNDARNRLLVEVEVESLSELEKAVNAGADIIMLDNFSADQCREAVRIRAQQNRYQPLLEASGNIDDQTIIRYAETGIDFISSGAMTKNITAIDLSLRIYP